MEQNLGPHMEQKWAVLAGSWGSVASWNRRAVTGSSDKLNWSYLVPTHQHPSIAVPRVMYDKKCTAVIL